MKNVPAQHVFSDDLPLPELPSIMSTADKASSSSSSKDNNKSGDLSLQYSVEEEDAGNSMSTTLARDVNTHDSHRESKSEC